MWMCIAMDDCYRANLNPKASEEEEEEEEEKKD